MTGPSPRFLWVYPDYGPARAAEEHAYAERMRAAGAVVHTFGIPCPGGWWPFAVLDERYRNGDPTLHAAYAAANGVERPPRDARGWRAFTPPAEPAVLFISVASDDTPANLAAFRRERWPMPWVNVLDEDTPGAVTKTLQVDKFPTALFVDARGIIVQRDGDLREGALALARTSPAGERRP